jgi:chromosome segregation protein
MYLKRLEIYGFKSFAHRSVLDFEYNEKGRNITAIVGPNGSGKSNVADAIRWVLGEQSTKLLRGKKSEDVLFLGNQTKARGSFSEVILFLESSKPAKVEVNGKPFELHEIEVSRKLYRSGDSEYLINRKKVRLVDVQQLLATLGFGQSTYTVIGQGMVDRLLFFSASERKTLFDEAAGVKQYEIKREQVVRRLGETGNNLIRLKDILGELEPRVINLRRLVKRAEGRKEIENELTSLQNKYYGNLIFEYRKKIENVEVKKELLNKKIVQFDKEILELEKEVNEGSSAAKILYERGNIERKIGESTTKRDSLMQKVAYIEGQINQQDGKTLFVNKQRDDFKKELLLTEEKIVFLKDRISGQSDSLKKIEIEQKQLDLEITNLEKELLNVDERLTNPKSSKDAVIAREIQNKIDDLEKDKHELVLSTYSLKQEENINRTRKENSEKKLEIEKEKLSNLKNTADLLKTNYNKLEAKGKEYERELRNQNEGLEKIVAKIKKLEDELREFTISSGIQGFAKLESELTEISTEREILYKRVQVCSSVKDLGVFKNEFSAFSKRLTHFFDRIKKHVKSSDTGGREKIEAELSGIRESQSLIGNRISELKISLTRVEMDLISKKAQMEDCLEKIKNKEEEIKIFEKHDFISNSENILFSQEKELEEINNKLSSFQLEYKKYSSSVNEYQNAILIEKNKIQDKLGKVRREKYELEVKITRTNGVIDNQKKEIDTAKIRTQEIEKLLSELTNVRIEKDEELIKELEINKKELKSYDSVLADFRLMLSNVISRQKESEQLGFELDRKRQAVVEKKAEITVEINTIELENVKNMTRMESILEEIRILGITVASIKESEHENLDQMEKDTLRAKIENLRRKLETIGGIDPETEKEYEELNLKNNEMKKQVEDLELAKENLEKVIKELDGKIKSQFSSAFKNIEEEFNRYFNTLFDGGRANLSLGADEEGSFGVEITATPPGKRVQSLSALSGGERTLTSLALLFAILSVNPSPFCVLDEVDAALDDSNALRFAKILHSLAKKTQFIVISHNQETMKAAENLYGVTMGDDHISKLISIRLADAIEAVK